METVIIFEARKLCLKSQLKMVISQFLPYEIFKKLTSMQPGKSRDKVKCQKVWHFLQFQE